MRNDKTHTRPNDQDFPPVTQFQRGNCDDWGIKIAKPHLKNWPDTSKTQKDCNDWMDETCREAMGRVQEFNRLVKKWKEDTLFMSSITQMAAHPAYLRIIGMGQPALSLVLKELREDPSHWFLALEAIAGQNPAENAATFDEGVEAWLSWGRMKGYIR